MPSHRRGRSLSEALTLEQLEEGGVVISSINNVSSSKGLKEGDEILGATINFDQLSKEEVLKVLKLMEPFNDKVQVLTRSKLSRSLGNLDECAKGPEAMLNDSYSKIYNAKIKKFLMDDVPRAEEGYVNGEVTAKPMVQSSSKVNLKNDMGLPRLGVDFGLLKSKTLSTAANADSQSYEGRLTDGINLNLPPLGLGLNGTTLRETQVPRLKLGARCPQLNDPDLPEGPNVSTTSGMQLPNTDCPSADTALPNLENPQIGLEVPEVGADLKGSNVTTPEMGIDLNGGNITGPSINSSVPKVGIEGTKRDFRMPKFKLPDLGLSGSSFSRPECEIKPPDVDTPDIPSGKLSLKYSKRLKSPDLNLDDPSGYVESPKLQMSGRSRDLDLETSSINVSQPDINGTDIDMLLGEIKMPQKKPRISLKSPDLDLDAPSGIFKSEADVKTPDLRLKMSKIKGGISAPDVSLPKADLKGLNFATDTPSVSIDGPSEKYKAPKFTMPTFDLPSIQVPGLNEKLDGPDVQLAGTQPKVPNLKLNADLKPPDLNLKSPDLNISGPNLSGGINVPDIDMPNIDLKAPKLKLGAPNANFDLPSGKLKMPELDAPDWDVNAPSGKLKKPKFNLSGALPKGPNLDLNADLKSPDWNLKAPKIKGGMDAPDLDLPDMDLKAPKLDMNTPDVNIGSPKGKLKFPKMKMPKFNLPSLKGPEIDGNLNGPDMDINAPNVNLKGPKADVDLDISGPSGKFKKPNLNLPDLGLSGPKLDGPNLDLKSPDLDISGPNLSGGINAPDIDVPGIDLKAPKLKLGAPNANLDLPSGKLKMPELHAPDWDINAPSGKLKKPKFNLSGGLPKGPNLDLNADLKSPDWNLKAPKIKGGMDAPDLDLPDMDLKAPKLDMNTPDVNIGSPKGKLKMPKLKMPKFNLPSHKGPEIDGNLDGSHIDLRAPNANFKGSKTGLEMPDVGFGSPSSKLKTPNLKLPDVGFSRPKLDGPDFEQNSPHLNVKAPKIKGGYDAPNLGLSNTDLKGSKTGFEFPDTDFGRPSGKFKTPHLKIPDVGLSAPKTDLPKADLSLPDLNAKLPKGSNLKLNSDLKTPDLNLKAPKMKGGLGVPKANMDLQAPNLDMNTPDTNIDFPDARLDVNVPKGKFKMPSLNTPDLSISGPQAKTPNMRLSGPSRSTPDLDLPDTTLKNARFNTKHPNLGINGNIRQPDVNFTGHQVRGMNMPLGNIRGPQVDLDLDRKAKLPSFKMSQFKSPDLHQASDIDFGASLRPTNLDFAPPNAKLNMKPPQMMGHISGPRVSASNMNLNMPKAAMRNPQQHLRSPGLNIDDPSLYYQRPSYKHRTLDMTNMNMKISDLDIDGDVTLRAADRKSARTNVRSSYPGMDDILGQRIDLNYSDLNIDDFTGRQHVLRARGSNRHLQDPHNYGQVISPSGVNSVMRDPRRIPSGHIKHNTHLSPFSPDSRMRAPNSSDGYYVTVFPTQAQNQKMPNRKYNTLGGLDFHPGNLDLEVPGEHARRGSLFFSNLV